MVCTMSWKQLKDARPQSTTCLKAFALGAGRHRALRTSGLRRVPAGCFVAMRTRRGHSFPARSVPTPSSRMRPSGATSRTVGTCCCTSSALRSSPSRAFSHSQISSGYRPLSGSTRKRASRGFTTSSSAHTPGPTNCPRCHLQESRKLLPSLSTMAFPHGCSTGRTHRSLPCSLPLGMPGRLNLQPWNSQYGRFTHAGFLNTRASLHSLRPIHGTCSCAPRAVFSHSTRRRHSTSSAPVAGLRSMKLSDQLLTRVLSRSSLQLHGPRSCFGGSTSKGTAQRISCQLLTISNLHTCTTRSCSPNRSTRSARAP